MATFDALAADYDAQFSHSRIGGRMRQAVWRRLDVHFAPGVRVLELNCGTGEDAVYLGHRGIQVLATDVSQEMVAIARQKVERAGLTASVQVQPLGLEALRTLKAPPFAGVLSNFGGLNCIATWSQVARDLATLLRLGAMAVLCVMGPIVPWEWGWFLAHGALGTALRRLRPGGARWRDLTIRYPSIYKLQHAFAPDFRCQRVSAVGALLPPPYTEAWMAKHPELLARLDRWERRIEAWPGVAWFADHYVLELERRHGDAPGSV